MKTFQCFFSCFLICLYVNGLDLKTSNQIITSLTAEIQKIAQIYPPNAASLIKNIQSTAFFNSDTFEVSQTIQILQSKLKLASNVINSFKNIIFSDSLTFQTFSASIVHQTGLVTEFIGCARKISNTVEIGYIQITSSGTVVIQYNNYKTRNCHKVLFWKKCHDEWHSVPRGFTPAEISIIFNALRSQAYLKGLQQLNNPPHTLLNFYSVQPISINENRIGYSSLEIETNMFLEGNENLIEKLIKEILIKIPEMKKDISQNTTTIVDKIVNRGFTFFKEKAAIQQLNGVQDQYFEMFLKNLKTTINLPQKYEKSFDSIMEVILYSSSNIWVVFDISFAIDSGAECKYVCVMARHDEINKKTDWLVADIAATFTLAPDVFIIQQKQSYLGGLFSNSQEKIVLKPASIKKNQLNVIFEFFEVISFERFAEILNINPNHEVTFIVPEIIGALTMAKSAVELVTSTWTSIVSAFKTSKSTELKEILQGKGFSYFSESGEMQKVTGLKLGYYNTFTNQLLNRIEVPDGKKTAFNEFFTDFTYMDDNVWKAFHTVFNQGTGEECKFVSIMAHHNSKDNTIDILIADFKAGFKLAPNIAVIQESKSILGGIYSDSKVVFKDIPRGVTTEDIQTVFDFFYIVAFKNFADLLEVKVDFPKIN